MDNPEKNVLLYHYRSYLLRIWLEDTQSKFPCRIALINSQTGERRGFVDFERLMIFLQNELRGESDSNPNETD